MSSVVIAGNTSGSITISAPDVSGSNTLTLPVATDTLVGKATTDTLTNKTLVNPTITGLQTLNTPNTFGFKNRIINGGMVIDQRNAGASVATASAAKSFAVDRFAFQVTQNAKFTGQQNSGAMTPAAGFNNYLGCVSTSAYSVASTDYFNVKQDVEGYNTADLAWGTANAQTVTLSFKVYSSLTGTFGGAIYNADGSRSYPFSYSIPVANTWTTISITIVGDTGGSGTWNTTNSIGITVNFSMGTGTTYSGTAGAWAGTYYASATGAVSVVGTSGATFYITGVQLEKGSTATSFDFRDYGRELAMCQRYFSIINDWYVRAYNIGGSYIGAPMTLPATMRTTPTVTVVGTPAYVNCSSMTAVANFGNSAIAMYAPLSGAGDTRFSCGGSSNYITSSAEL